MATQKKKRKTKPKQSSFEKQGDIRAISLISIGIILAFSTYTNIAGILSILIRNVLYSVIGIIIYIIPIYLIYLGINTIKSKGNITYSRKLFSISLFFIVIWLFCSTLNINTIVNYVDNINFTNILKELSFYTNKSLHGGVLAYLITYPLYKLTGFVGSYIIYIALLLICIILFLDITLYDIYIKFKDIITLIKTNFSSVENITEKKGSKSKKRKHNTSSLDLNDNENNYINDITSKIEILDFMKNSNLENLSPLQDFNINDDIEEKINHSNHPSTRLNNTSYEPKDVLNKEIENNLNSFEKSIEKTYVFPDIELLNINSKLKLKNEDKKDLIDNASKLEETLSNFGVDAKVIQVTKGPSVTRFELQPSPGVKVSKIVNLQDDIALGLAANGVRIEAPIPGKAAIGIEVPNKKQAPVFLREVLESKEFTDTDKTLAFALGKDITGKCIVGDLNKMPHMLIAGATGSGKSVCINTLIISLLYKYSPKDVKLLMIDPKVVELSVYNGIPHLLIPVVTDPKKAAGALNWAVNEMNKRYNLFSQMKVKNIESYNNLYKKGQIEEKLPYVVMIVDELADLMMACPNDVEDYICRLAQMARAAGMHLIIATQRPSVDVITGVIKANIPSRISFAVSSGIDSRTILDQTGAEKLLGRGDMLYNPIGENKPLRVQGSFISEEEVESVVEFIKSSYEEVAYSDDIIDHINNENVTEVVSDSESDELLDEAIKIVIEYQQASTSFIQRKLRVGFNRASRIMDELEERGIISEKDGSRPRQVLISKDEICTKD